MRFAPALVSEMVVEARVPAIWKSHAGVVVPTPTLNAKLFLRVVEVATKWPTVSRGVPDATRLEPSQDTIAPVENPVVLRPSVPDVVIVPPVNPLLVATDVTVPDPPPLPLTHTPAIEKHPVRTFMPDPKVEVAFWLSEIVLLPVLPSANVVPGVLVPMPISPLLVIVSADTEEVAYRSDDVAR